MRSKHQIVGYLKIGILLFGVSTAVGLIERWSGAFGLSWWILTWAWQRGFRPKWLLFAGVVMDFWLIRPLGLSAVVAGIMVLLLMWTGEKRLPWWIWWGVASLLTIALGVVLVDPSVTIQRVLLPLFALVVLVWSQRQSS